MFFYFCVHSRFTKHLSENEIKYTKGNIESFKQVVYMFEKGSKQETVRPKLLASFTLLIYLSSSFSRFR